MSGGLRERGRKGSGSGEEDLRLRGSNSGARGSSVWVNPCRTSHCPQSLRITKCTCFYVVNEANTLEL